MRVQPQLLSGLFLAACCLATGHAEESPAPTSTAAEVGMRAYVDPATGELSAEPVTAEQKRAAESADGLFRQDDQGLRIVYFEDGSSMMDLQGRFQQATVAEVQADGRLRTWCNDADHLALGPHQHDGGAEATTTVPTREQR